MKDMSVIYKITNPKGKSYIGQTKNLKQRLSQHKKCKEKHHPKLARSIAKYGWDNHTVEIIDECKTILPTLLNLLEKYWIAELDTYKNGLNCTHGGENFFKNRNHTEETKLKISMASRRPCPEHVKKFLSESRKGKSLNLTQEQRDNLSLKAKNKIVTQETKEKRRVTDKSEYDNILRLRATGLSYAKIAAIVGTYGVNIDIIINKYSKNG